MSAIRSRESATITSLRVKHIVMWNVRSDTPDERRRSIALVKNGFESLQGRIPGLIVVEVGVDHSRIDYACDVVLYTEFEDQASLDAYTVHPAHLSLRDQLAGVRTARHQVDYHHS
ncbi:stress responsive protein [Sphingomonas sp. Leaf25]|nr:stress responsive protein [Sphingomonas sp. Leaf25]